MTDRNAPKYAFGCYKILEHANRNLKQHPEYENWMLFDGAKVSPTGVIIPTF
jgi:hypothetical protein